MKLTELLNKVKIIQVVGAAEHVDIDSITIDSRTASKKCMFFAIAGLEKDGHSFIPDVINNGAAAVVMQNNNSVPDQIFTHANCIKIVVEDSRKALAEFSNVFYGEPSKKLKLIGITGTKGKTTTAFYVKHLFENAGYKTGLIGTIANYIGPKEIKTMLTTPQAHEINALLSQMVLEGCTHCVMEVSSHALRLNRVDFLKFSAAIFTNITSDHMDYHQTFEHYFDSKKILFDKIAKDGIVVFNADDPNGKKIVKSSHAKKISVGSGKTTAYKLEKIEFSLNGTEFDLEIEKKKYHLTTNLVGNFNAYNAALAFTTAVSLGVKIKSAIEGVRTTPQVPGRFEVVARKNKKVIIDYSHTSDSLKQALAAVKHIVKNERPIYTIFGCGGNRDRTKRPIMGGIAAEMSNTVYITSDNPRKEDPNFIIEEIIKGISTNNFIVIENREEAIKTAIKNSEENAVILIAGKGHENYQEINGVRSHFSDKEMAEKYLSEWEK